MKRPWTIGITFPEYADFDEPRVAEYNLFDADGEWVAYTGTVQPKAERKAAAVFLRTVVNVHDDLVAALEVAENFISGFEGDEVQEGVDEMLERIRAALKKAGVTW